MLLSPSLAHVARVPCCSSGKAVLAMLDCYVMETCFENLSLLEDEDKELVLEVEDSISEI
jgi:hypothetical protein